MSAAIAPQQSVVAAPGATEPLPPAIVVEGAAGPAEGSVVLGKPEQHNEPVVVDGSKAAGSDEAPTEAGGAGAGAMVSMPPTAEGGGGGEGPIPIPIQVPPPPVPTLPRPADGAAGGASGMPMPRACAICCRLAISAPRCCILCSIVASGA